MNAFLKTRGGAKLYSGVTTMNASCFYGCALHRTASGGLRWACQAQSAGVHRLTALEKLDGPVWAGHDRPAPPGAVTWDAAADADADAPVIKIEHEGPMSESSSRPAHRELKVSFLPPPTFARRIRPTAANLLQTAQLG